MPSASHKSLFTKRRTYPSKAPEPYRELVQNQILNEDGTVHTSFELVTMEHPCAQLNANHFRLDVVIEAAPETLQPTNFKVTDNFKVVDNLNKATAQLNEII